MWALWSAPVGSIAPFTCGEPAWRLPLTDSEYGPDGGGGQVAGDPRFISFTAGEYATWVTGNLSGFLPRAARRQSSISENAESIDSMQAYSFLTHDFHTAEVIKMLKQYTPLALTFARAQADQTSTVKTYLTSSPLSLDIESAYTFSIPADDYIHLGCKFVTGMNGSGIVVKHMSGVDRPFKRQMNSSKYPFLGCKLESVDVEAVSSYVNCQLIVNAMKRRWAANGQVDLAFCNETHRKSLRAVKSCNDTS